MAFVVADQQPLISHATAAMMQDMGAPQTIPALFSNAVRAAPTKDALATIHEGELLWRTWQTISADVCRLATALLAHGVEPGDRVAQISANSYEWILTDLAIQLVRAVHVPIHGSLAISQIAEQISDCGAKLVFMADGSRLADLAGHVQAKAAFVGPDDFDTRKHKGIATWQEFNQNSDQKQEVLPEDFLQSLAHAVQPEDLATLIYTSGTTGQPRGVRLSQHNLAGNAIATSDTTDGDSSDLRICFLPLSHIYARTCDLYSWIYLQSRFVLAQSRDTIVDDCQLVHPNTLNAVPYFYQKMHDRIRAAKLEDEADALHATFGGNVRKLFCGGAALSLELDRWFADCGLPILPGYGLTEASPVVSVTTLSVRREGSSGKPLPGVEVRIADDGEILVRGSNLMQGYWQDDAGTNEMIRDGWLHTGDTGHLDEDGFLFIRGRKKELIVLSTGKNVSPTRVENLLAGSPLIEQVVVVGDDRSYLAALIVPSEQALRSQKVRAKIAEEIASRLANAAREEQVHAFTLLERAFSIESGELTPKLSLRRNVIARNFEKDIAAMYLRDRSCEEEHHR